MRPPTHALRALAAALALPLGAGPTLARAEAPSVDDKTTIDKTTTDKSTTDKSTTDKSTTDKSTTDKSTTDNTATDKTATYKTAARAKPLDRFEPTVLPVIANDPDVGFKFGVFAQLARYRDDIAPYAWRVQLGAVLSYKDGASGAEFPFRELVLRADVPRINSSKTRLFTELLYLRTTNRGYFGLGNGSTASTAWLGLQPGTEAYTLARQLNQYDGITRELGAGVSHPIAGPWRLHGGLRVRWAQLGAYEGSLLAEHIAHGPGGGRLLYGLGESLYPLLQSGVLYDSRNDETIPTRGAYHEAALRCSPGGLADGGWCGATLILRGYVSILGPRLHFAGRLLGDVLFGRPPLYELARFGGLEPSNGPGGGLAVRGLPQGRYHGHTKLIGNVEVRSFFWPFRLGKQRFELGAAGFFDFGRVWTSTLDGDRSLDGVGLALRWGTGGGLRLRWGESLVIRIDAAYSPVAAELGTQVGLYLDFDPLI